MQFFAAVGRKPVFGPQAPGKGFNLQARKYWDITHPPCRLHGLPGFRVEVRGAKGPHLDTADGGWPHKHHLAGKRFSEGDKFQQMLAAMPGNGKNKVPLFSQMLAQEGERLALVLAGTELLSLHWCLLRAVYIE